MTKELKHEWMKEKEKEWKKYQTFRKNKVLAMKNLRMRIGEREKEETNYEEIKKDRTKKYW